MKKQLVLIATLAGALFLTACAKQDKVPAAETEASATTQNDQVTPEQQAAIDAIDKPILDEKNQDVPAEVMNVPADTVTVHDENK
jgi:PBP1b-binding outer membrane lipoprotein LpoB